MTVKTLIKKLLEYPLDTEVTILNSSKHLDGEYKATKSTYELVSKTNGETFTTFCIGTNYNKAIWTE